MRRSFNGLAALVFQAGRTPLDGARYVFVNRDCTQVRIRRGDNGGLTIWAKRLEKGKFQASATALEPVYQCLKKFILGTGFIFTDDTPVDLQVKGAGKTIQGRMWVYATLVDGRPQMVCEFTRDRLKYRPREFIGADKGFVHADAYPGYDHLFDPENIWECACWMHIRRKFFEAQDGPPELRPLAIGADPYEYLANVLARVQGHPAKRLAELRPINWLAAKKAAADSAPAA